MRAHGAMWSSDQMPVSFGLIRPSGETAVASAMTSPAPPTAREIRCVSCHASGAPVASLENMHIGEMPMRFRKVWPRRVRGVNRVLMGK